MKNILFIEIWGKPQGSNEYLVTTTCDNDENLMRKLNSRNMRGGNSTTMKDLLPRKFCSHKTYKNTHQIACHYSDVLLTTTTLTTPPLTTKITTNNCHITLMPPIAIAPMSPSDHRPKTIVADLLLTTP